MSEPSSRNWSPLAFVNKNEYVTLRRLAFRLILKLRARIACIKNVGNDLVFGDGHVRIHGFRRRTVDGGLDNH